MGGELILQRIAVTLDQQRQFDLQTSPPKKIDKRKAYFDDDITVQAEALPPDLLQQIVGESIAADDGSGFTGSPTGDRGGGEGAVGCPPSRD